MAKQHPSELRKAADTRKEVLSVVDESTFVPDSTAINSEEYREEMQTLVERAAPTDKSVLFVTDQLNLRVYIQTPRRDHRGEPIYNAHTGRAAVDSRLVEFRAGVFATEEAEVIKALQDPGIGFGKVYWQGKLPAAVLEEVKYRRELLTSEQADATYAP